MLRPYLRLAIRHLRRNPAYTALNVIGLAVGMATCLLITLYVSEELGYDRFHPNADRIQVLTVESGLMGTTRITPYPLGDAITGTVPGIERVTRTKGAGARPFRVASEEATFDGERVVLETDSLFFDVFAGFPFLQGDRSTALDGPQSVVLTRETAREIFGDSNPIGQTVQIGDRQSAGEGAGRRFQVTGVVDVPTTSTVQFDAAIPMSVSPAQASQWGAFAYHTFALTEPGVGVEALEDRIASAAGDALPEFVDAVGAMSLPDLYLSDLYSTSGFRGQTRYLYVFGTIALLVLLIGGINYMNLMTAQATDRAREVGIRKAVGAHASQLTGQFLGEALLVSSVSAGLAVVLSGVSLPVFNALFGTQLSLSALPYGWVTAAVVAIVAGTGLASGLYPAFVLSRFQPARVLRSSSALRSGGGGWLQKGLVTVQFAASAGLILGTIVIYQQLQYVQTKNLGFNGEQVLTIEMEGIDKNRHETVRQEVLQHPSVEQASVGSSMPGNFGITFRVEPESVSDAANTEVENVTINPVTVDPHYISTLGIELLAGRNVSADRPSDRSQAYLLNEAAVEAFGWSPETAVGKPFLFARSQGGDDGPVGEVIGVVRDFHIASLRYEIQPVVLQMEATQFSSDGDLAVRVAPDGIQDAVAHVTSTLEAAGMEDASGYEFLDASFDAMYRSETRIAQIFGGFAGIAVVIACMGLFGLAAFTAQQRRKEIGIQKALGASVSNVVVLLLRGYSLVVVLAIAIGMPLAYAGTQTWLEDFAFRVDVGARAFVVTAILAITIAGLSAGYHAVRAARLDPALTLRDE